jgi:F-type H+-transporting ATPase subunit delta
VVSKVLVSKISEPYAGALLELAKSKDSVDEITADVNDLLTLLVSVPELTSYLGNPVISNEKKKGLLKEVIGSKLNQVTLNFLLFLIDRRRISFFEAIGENFLKLVFEFSDIYVAKVQTRVPLSYLQEERLISKLVKLTGGKEIRLMHTIDTSIIGGLVVQIGSQVIDISLKGQLRQISNSLETSLII